MASFDNLSVAVVSCLKTAAAVVVAGVVDSVQQGLANATERRSWLLKENSVAAGVTPIGPVEGPGRIGGWIVAAVVVAVVVEIDWWMVVARRSKIVDAQFG